MFKSIEWFQYEGNTGILWVKQILEQDFPNKTYSHHTI